MKLSLFYEILRMSFTASFVIIIALCCRMLLKKAPKIFSYALWGVVLFRLLCPVSIHLPFSFVPDSVTQNAALEQIATRHNSSQAEDTGYSEFTTAVTSKEETVQNTTKENRSKENDVSKTLPLGLSDIRLTDGIAAIQQLPAVALVLSNIWLTGMGVILLYSVISLIRLKRKLVGSIPYQKSENIYLSDYIETPFVIGLLRPRIYLPSSLNDTEMEYVLLHEKHHIYRKDHWVKILAYAALILHWFNPFVWIAFVLAGKDMEMSCDEAVMKKMGGQICEEYSMLLLRLATGKTRISPTPLAFGEGDTKERIVNVLKWKKPARWIVVFATIVCMVTAVGCAVNKKGTNVTTAGNKSSISTGRGYAIPNHYQRSDGKWVAEIMSEDDGTVEKKIFKYRYMIHGKMPNALFATNFVILSNRDDITFEKAYKASGVSSNSKDYFNPNDTVFVSQWEGDLGTPKPGQDEDTIYIIEEELKETEAPKATEEPGVVLKKVLNEFGINSARIEGWMDKMEVLQMNEKSLKISYQETIMDSNCTLTIRKDGKKIKTDYEFDDSLTIMWGMMGEIEVKSTADRKVVCASWEQDGYTFLICAIAAGEEEDEIDPSTIGKEASYIIKAFE